MRYKQEQMVQWDVYADLNTAKKEGREEGMGIGERRGREEGMAIGEEKIIRNLLESGKFNVSEVALYARVPEAVVRKVKKSMQKS
jgi:predicted transposase YdaD